MFRHPRPRTELLRRTRKTVSTNHIQLEMNRTAPQRIEIRVNEQIWSCFFTLQATNINISWNFRDFWFCVWPWACKISCQNNFTGHNGPINATSELSTNWRAEIKIYRAYLTQFTKTWPTCPKIRLAIFMLRRPRPGTVLPRRTLQLSLQIKYRGILIANVSKIRTLHHRKSKSKTAKTLIREAPIVEQSPSLVLLLYGLTTLQIMPLPYGRRETSGPRQGGKAGKKIKTRARKRYVLANFSILSSNEIADFSIRGPKISNHGTRCLGTYNFFVSQRWKLILCENKIQKCCGILIAILFQDPHVTPSKI